MSGSIFVLLCFVCRTGYLVVVILQHFEQALLQSVHLRHVGIIPHCFKNESNNKSLYLKNDFEQSSENSIIASLILENTN